jgi:hypothetical protein
MRAALPLTLYTPHPDCDNWIDSAPSALPGAEPSPSRRSCRVDLLVRTTGSTIPRATRTHRLEDAGMLLLRSGLLGI